MADCQVDFYILNTAGEDSGKLACRLAVMSWERGHQTLLIAPTPDQARSLDELLWSYPPERFAPHGIAGEPAAVKAPIIIAMDPDQASADVVINLCPQPIDQPERFQRLLEIVPGIEEERRASREKFRFYRQRGLAPKTHEISK